MRGPKLPRKTRILCVDDDPATNRIHAIVLGDQPDMYVVASASQAEEVLPAIEAHRPDVVLLDYLLRGSRCEDLLRAITHAHPRVRVIILSGMDPAGLPPDLQKAGASAFVTKGADLDGFREEIREAIRRAKVE
jgi:DNA-binding NarL/FixJ family response regulator